jgi:drug/metabolite transporter (DMT)-like permease
MTVMILTAFTMIAFAANSLLCRLALSDPLIDPVSFTTIRLVSGALVLIPVSRLVAEPRSQRDKSGSWASGFALFAYAAAFSLAYVSLNAGMGALILFGAVQVTMIVAALRSGEKLGFAQWAGSITAIGGLIYLVLPGISAPDPTGALLMCVSGVAWGLYSIRGKNVDAPAAMTAANFLRAAPFAVLASVFAFSRIQMEPVGILLAAISGVVTSGLGYVLWYKALRGLTTAQASIIQLLVPVLAAFGGIVFLSEQVSMRLIAASALILGGVGLAVLKRGPRARSRAGTG